MTRHDTTAHDTPDMTWHQVLTANRNRSAIFHARAIHTLPVNHNGSTIPNAHSAISNAHGHDALSANHNRRACSGPRRPRHAYPPRVPITIGGRPGGTKRQRRAHCPRVAITIGRRPGVTKPQRRAHPACVPITTGGRPGVTGYKTARALNLRESQSQEQGSQTDPRAHTLRQAICMQINIRELSGRTHPLPWLLHVIQAPQARECKSPIAARWRTRPDPRAHTLRPATTLARDCKFPIAARPRTRPDPRTPSAH